MAHTACLGPGYGISPSDDNATVISHARCPYCGFGDARVTSPVGKSQLVRQAHCNHCRSVFEVIRW
ncbi:PaaD-like zinc ribbon domain-containing protein [Alicyclobacillus sendaiensis]|uniref:PaaD-like zinc ribbon domain-containing protein n=1 Tax=Alicyclobacillus sendaiensis TaxID=192387 RepID=UPI0009702559